MEYILVKFDDQNKNARVSLRAQELLAILNQREAENPTGEVYKKINLFFFKKFKRKMKFIIFRSEIIVAS